VNEPLIRFLQEELAIPEAAIAVALRHQGSYANMLPMILWQYGMVSLDDLARIFDWLESVS